MTVLTEITNLSAAVKERRLFCLLLSAALPAQLLTNSV
jgi:hypothetical protein